jgi:hypothetical protein
LDARWKRVRSRSVRGAARDCDVMVSHDRAVKMEDKSR